MKSYSPEIGEIYQRLILRFNKAVKFHKDSAMFFNFLGYDGFHKLHEFQQIEETLNCGRVKKYYTEAYGKLPMVEGEFTPIEVIPKDWGKYTRKDVTPQVRMQQVIKNFEAYSDWETESELAYSTEAENLAKLNCMSDFSLIKEIAKDTAHEMVLVDNLILKMAATNYDSVYLNDLQELIIKFCDKKAKTLKMN